MWMDWDNRTQTGARASGVEEITLRMAVHTLVIRPDTERELWNTTWMHEGRLQSWWDVGNAGCRLNP